MPSGKVFGNEKHDWSIRRNLAQKQKLLKTFHSCSSDHPFPNEFFVFFRRLQDFGKKYLFQRIMTHKSELRSVAHRLPAHVSVNSTAIWEEKRRHSPTGKWEVIVKPPPPQLPLSPRCNFEIQLRQTALHAGWLPGSTVVNNRRVSVSWLPNQSGGCVHFNTLSGELYGFLFWHFAVANNAGWGGNPPASEFCDISRVEINLVKHQWMDQFFRLRRF